MNGLASLREAGALVKSFKSQLLENQNRLLSELLNEVRSLNRRLSSLRLEVKAVTGVTDKKLPSFIQGNPWVEILSERR